jgi:transcriptional regulator with XRE-family HTH domain
VTSDPTPDGAAISPNDDLDDRAQLQKEALARNVRAARRQRRWTQEILGDRSGLGRAVIHRTEKAVSNLTIESINAIARALELGEDGSSILLASTGPASNADVSRESGREKRPVRAEAVDKPRLISKDHLAIELPAGQAFEAARLLANHFGHSITLVDPSNRLVAGIATKNASGDSQPD